MRADAPAGVPSAFLTTEEIVHLTDRKSPKAQKECLARQRIRFVETASGKPRVLRAALEQRMGVAISVFDEATTFPVVRPNFNAIRK